MTIDPTRRIAPAHLRTCAGSRGDGHAAAIAGPFAGQGRDPGWQSRRVGRGGRVAAEIIDTQLQPR